MPPSSAASRYRRFVAAATRSAIGGPAGAFIVLVAATVTRFGLDGLLLTVFLSGFMLTLIGLLRLGSLIRYIPHPVTVGFTCGIAVTIFASQIKDLAGLKLPAAEPGPLLPKLAALAQVLPTISPAAIAVGLGSVGLIFLLRSLRPNWPGMLIAVSLPRWRHGRSICLSRRSPAVSVSSPPVCLRRDGPRSRCLPCSRFCRPRSPSRCWEPWKACCPPRWRTA
jgi:hypothetical protein